MSELQNVPAQDESLIFCDLSVFRDEERDNHMKVAEQLLAKTLELRESDDGFALRMPDDDGIILEMADFIKDDRRCCAFIHFAIDVEPQGKGIWLTLKGGVDTKEAIRSDLFGFLPDGIAD